MSLQAHWLANRSTDLVVPRLRLFRQQYGEFLQLQFADEGWRESEKARARQADLYWFAAESVARCHRLDNHRVDQWEPGDAWLAYEAAMERLSDSMGELAARRLRVVGDGT